MKKPTKVIVMMTVFTVQAVVFGYIALHRFVDGDEGFYLLASRLIIMHQRPYADFFYTQAPLLPYVYALWLKVAGINWVSAKAFAALLTASTGAILFEDVYHESSKCLVGIVAVIIFAANALVFSWYPVVKTYSLAALLLFSAYVLTSRALKKRPAWLVVAGLLLGLSVSTRSYLVVLLPLFVLWIWRNSCAPSRESSTLWLFGTGVVVGLIPCIFFFILSPRVFLFDNLGYHALRTSAGLVGVWQEKLAVVLALFLRGTQGIQNGILCFLAIGFLSCATEVGASCQLASQIAVMVGLVSLLPTPAYPQYFCLAVPFLAVVVAKSFSGMLRDFHSKHAVVVVSVGCAAVLAAYVAAGHEEFRRIMSTGDEFLFAGAHTRAENWKLDRLVGISQFVDQIAGQGEVVASLWPGYLFETRAMPLRGLENDFGAAVSEKLTAEQRATYHILSRQDIANDVAARVPQIVILGNENVYVTQLLGDENIVGLLRKQGYAIVRSIGGASIYAYTGKGQSNQDGAN